jgi:hypothetical protein
MEKRKIQYIGALLAGLLGIGLFPTESKVVPDWKLRVLHADGTPANSVEVLLEWTNFDLEAPTTPWHKEFGKTDSAGYVTFPARIVRTTLLQKTVFVPLKRNLGFFTPHEGVGTQAGIQVSGYRNTLRYSEESPLPQELILEK